MATWTSASKNSATWTSASKNSATWSSENKNLGGFGYLLQENGDFLLLESLDKIILEQTNAGAITWTAQTKS